MAIDRYCVAPSSVTNFWNFDEGRGTTVADIIGTNNGTLGAGIRWAQHTRYGKALDLTYGGTVNFGDTTVINGAQKLSIGFSILKTASMAGSNNIIMRKFKDADEFIQVNWSNDPLLYFQLFNITKIWSTNQSLNKWYRYLFVFDGTFEEEADRLKLYENGIPLAGSGGTGEMSSTLPNVAPGALTLGSGIAHPNAQIDNLTLWSVALTADQAVIDYRKNNRKVRCPLYINLPMRG